MGRKCVLHASLLYRLPHVSVWLCDNSSVVYVNTQQSSLTWAPHLSLLSWPGLFLLPVLLE